MDSDSSTVATQPPTEISGLQYNLDVPENDGEISSTVVILPRNEIYHFQDHLNDPQNHCTIFSGPFGCGKTYFLKDFFAQNQEEFEVIYLCPVNYSIASNEDIMEYIKADIAFELFGKNTDFGKIDFEAIFTAQFFLKERFEGLVCQLLRTGGKVGKTFATAIESISRLKTDFDEFAKNATVDEAEELKSYIKTVRDRTGSIYEENDMTLLLGKLIGSLKQQGKRIVLIVDDLDRLDPEHIFRILNVFAAHMDKDTGTNKFDFDKIVLVGDVENIRCIFHHRYGPKTDFIGYLDKFYSREIFFFNQGRYVTKDLKGILDNIYFSFTRKSEREEFYAVFIPLVRMLISERMLSLRKLIEKQGREWELPIVEYSKKLSGTKTSRQLAFLVDFILFLYGNCLEDILHLFDKKIEINSVLNNLDYNLIYRLLIQGAIIAEKEEYFNDSKSGSIIIDNIKINYTIEDREINFDVEVVTVTPDARSMDQHVPFKQLFQRVIEYYTRLNSRYERL